MEKDSLVGRQIGAYLIHSKIGEGGMARVYKASHTRLRRDVAIKVILSNVAQQADFKARFEREAQLIASLHHQNIVAIYDFGEENNLTYLVMQHVGGGTLRDNLLHRQPLPLTLSVMYAIQIAQALHHAHLQGIVHRDVKPSNILISTSAMHHLLLTDFGIAKIFDLRKEVTWSEDDFKRVGSNHDFSSTGPAIVGTPSYMAPEQILGKIVDARTDVYALGIVLFEMLTGILPFKGNTPLDLMFQRIQEPAVSVNMINPTVPEMLAQVVRQALERDPAARFQSANAMEKALKNVMNSIILADPQKTLPARCNVCGTTPEPDDRFCQKCGNTLLLNNSAYDQTVASMAEQSQLPVPHPSVAKTLFSFSDLSTASLSSNPPASVEKVEERNALTLYKCPFCNEETRPGDAFCLNCGNRLPAIASSVQQENPGTIGTRLVEAFEDHLHTATVESVAYTQEQAAQTNSGSFTTDAGSPSQVSRPPDATAALDQTVAQLLKEGEANYNTKRYHDALLIYNHILQLDPVSAIAYGKKGNALGKLKKYKEAYEAYEAALTIEAHHPSIHSAKGDVLYRLKRYSEAIVAYDAALALNPQNSLIWVAKGNTLCKLKRHEEALEAYGEAINLNVSYDVIWVKAKVLFELERYDESLVAYEHALNYAPKKSGLWDGKGEVLYKLKHYEKALEAHNRALALDPYNAFISSKCDRLRDLLTHLPAKPQPVQANKHSIENVARANPMDATRGDQGVYTQVQSQTNSLTSKDLAFPVEKEPSTAVDPTTKDESTRLALPIKQIDSPGSYNDATGQTEYFDVFISYSHVDLTWVENLAKHLEDKHHFRVWLDKWVLIPGKPWQQAMARGISGAHCCVVCISAQTPKGWCTREIQKALSRQVNDASFGVIPVLLPDAKSINIDEFLEMNTWVDFRLPDHDYELHRLACGIKGIPPGRWPLNEQTTTTTRIDPTVEEMLNDLQRLRSTGLITDSVKEEYIRITMEKVWFAKWTLQPKDRTNE